MDTVLGTEKTESSEGNFGDSIVFPCELDNPVSFELCFG